MIAAKRRRMQLGLLAGTLLAYAGLPSAIGLLTSGRVSVQNSTGSVVLGPAGESARQILLYVIIVVGVGVIMRNGFKGHTMNRTLLSYFIGFAILAALSSYFERDIHVTSMIPPLLAMAVALWSMDLCLNDLVVVAYVGIAVSAASLFMAITTPMAWMAPAGESKALVGSRLLAGFFPEMNLLALSVGPCLPFVFLIKRPKARFLGALLLLTTLVLASSRTILIAGAMSLGMMLLLAIFARRTRNRAMVLIIAAVAAVAAALPWAVNDDRLFTDRGLVWRVTTGLVRGHLVTGLGPEAFALNGTVQQITGALYWHGHNTFLSFLVYGGAVALLALLCFLIPLFHRSVTLAKRSMVPALSLVMTLGMGIAETALRPDTFDATNWITWLCVLACGVVSADHDHEFDVDGRVDTYPDSIGN